MSSAVDDRSLIRDLLGAAAAEQVVHLPVEELLELAPAGLTSLGLNRSSRRRLLACAELARRFQPASSPPRPVLCPRDALPHLARLRAVSSEVLAILPLDARFHVIQGLVRVAQGSVSRLAAEPREVFAVALERRASSLLLAHNHPSGVAEPSPEDLAFTRTMQAAGALLGIPILDHLVVARRAYFSFAAHGLLQPPGPESTDGGSRRPCAEFHRSPSKCWPWAEWTRRNPASATASVPGAGSPSALRGERTRQVRARP